MPSNNRLPNTPIPLPLTLYVIPLAIMVEYIALQLWNLIHQSLETEDFSPPSSSSSPPMPSLEENHLVSSYETLPSSSSHVLPIRLRGTHIKETPAERSPETLRNLSAPSPTYPTLWQCLLCCSLKYELQTCPQYRCPICLHLAPGHGNNLCPNSPIDPDSSDEEWPDNF